MSWHLKIILLCTITLWSVGVWAAYFDKKETTVPSHYQLSDDFWTWEAEGRLALIDMVLDDADITIARQTWEQGGSQTDKTANILINKQNQAYGYNGDGVRIVNADMRGDANGYYDPTLKTIFINQKMNWSVLPFERFAEVILHENMHHILSHQNNDVLADDFQYLKMAGIYHSDHDEMMIADEMKSYNPQEYIAYRTQRAARFAGLDGADLSVWEITTRMQELKSLTKHTLTAAQ